MRLLLVFVCLSLVVSCTRVDPAARAPEVFEQVCSRCHGVDLEGGPGPSLGPGSDAASKIDGSLLTTITHGRGRMPSFGNQLTEAQIRDLVDYIRSVQGAG